MPQLRQNDSVQLAKRATFKLTFILFVTFISFLILAPIFTSAKGLVPCGGCEVWNEATGGCITPEPECDLCCFLTMIKNIIDFLLFKLAGPLFFALIVIGAIILLVGGASPKLQETGKKAITSAVIGLVIMFSSWIIVSSILTATGFNQADSWYKFDCGCGGVPPPPPPTYLACENMACVEKEGDKPNECSADKDCYHLVCDENFDCIKTEGKATDKCSPEGSKCPSHLECARYGQCILVAEGGSNKDGCTSPGQTCSAWHLDCNPISLICEKAIGADKDRCEVIDTRCRIYYLKCDENNMCIKIWDERKDDECEKEGEPCPTKPACNDGEDNDGDKKIDFPEDPGCTSKDDNNEREYNGPQCDNGRDDDGDNKIDYKADGTGDPECISPDDNDEADGIEACTEDRECELGYICKTLEGGQKGCVPGCRTDPDCPSGQICENGECIAGCRSCQANQKSVCYKRHDRCPGGTCTEFKCCAGCVCECHGLDCILMKDYCYPSGIKPQCSDGKDNDGDFYIDFPSDPGCTSADDNDEKEEKPFEGYTLQVKKEQKDHASQALIALLACMKDKLPAEARVISSISDDGILSNPVRCDYLKCSGNICGGCSGCAHTCNSCHYGGKNCNTQERFSYAVDFAKEEYCEQIKTAALECNADAFVNYEGNHIHISLNKPSGCECNEAAVGKPCPATKLTVLITSPADGSQFKLGENIFFNSSVSGDSSPYAYSWNSSIDENIGNSKSFPRNDLSPGDHTITLTVTDDAGKVGTANIKIHIISSSFDWRNKDGYNWLTPVEDQGGCGSCWAHAATAVVEAKYNIQNNNPNLDIELSRQYLVSDCYLGGDCDGGPGIGVEFSFIKNEGIVEENCCPYLGEDSTCLTCSDWESRLWRITNYYAIFSSSRMKSELVDKGPLYAIMGIDKWDPGTYTCTEGGEADHAVVIVGYDDTEGVWIVRNSWGTDWEDGGYFKVAYGECFIEDYYAISVDKVIAP